MESTLVGLKMVDDHRKGVDTTKKFKFIDIFSAFSPRPNNAGEGKFEMEIDEDEDFEVKQVKIIY